MSFGFCALNHATYGGVYYTANFTASGAITWTKLTTTGLANNLIKWFRVDPFNPLNRQYVILDNSQLYTRNGGDWSMIMNTTIARALTATDPSLSMDIRSIFPDPLNEGRIWCLFRNALSYPDDYQIYILKSDDYGANWTYVKGRYSNLGTDADKNEIQMYGSKGWIIYNSNVIGIPNLQAFYTYDTGWTWINTNNFYCADATAVGVDRNDPTICFLYKQDGSLAQVQGGGVIAELLTKAAIGDALGVRPAERIWFEQGNSNHSRLLAPSQNLYYTSDGWATYSTTDHNVDNVGFLCAPENTTSDMVVFGRWDTGTPVFYALDNEADATPTVRNGANYLTSPYTDAVPGDVGFIAYYGLWVGDSPVVSGVHVFSVEEDDITDIYYHDGLGIPMFGDRSSWRDYDADTDGASTPLSYYHAEDIRDEQPQRHNPWPATAGTAPVSDGSKWVATDIVTQAEFDDSIFAAGSSRNEVTTSAPGGTINFIDSAITVIDDTNSNALPHIALMANGSLITVYRQATSHGGSKGTIRTQTSADNGATWSAAATIYVDATYDSRDPCVMVDENGRVWCNFFFAVAATGAHIVDGVRISYSDDNGATWSALATVNSAFTLDCACSGPIVETPEDYLILPMYGKNTGDTYYSASVIKSTDGGTTWTSEVVVANGESASRMYAEPNLIYLNYFGIILCMMRSDTPDVAGGDFWASFTMDDGATWSDAIEKFSATGAPRMCQLKNDMLLIIYRNPLDITECLYRICRDNGYSWSDSSLVDDSATYQFAYAGAVEYDEGIIGFVIGVENDPGGTDGIVYFYRMYTTVEAGQLQSNVATGIAPLVVNSTTVVTNLNADMVDGNHGHAAVTLDVDAAVILDITAGQEIGLDVQNANTVFAGPTSGAANEPTFRALVDADLPTGDMHGHVINEDHSAACDDVTVAFPTSFDFLASTTAVYLNGLRQRLSIHYTEDVTLDGITFITAPETGDELVIDYIVTFEDWILWKASIAEAMLDSDDEELQDSDGEFLADST